MLNIGTSFQSAEVTKIQLLTLLVKKLTRKIGPNCNRKIFMATKVPAIDGSACGRRNCLWPKE